MIYFYDIFEICIALFDDPDLSREYYENKALFQADMRDFLMVGRKKFNRPTAICDKLTEMDSPKGVCESDNGTNTDTYVLDEPVPTKEEFGDHPKVGFTFAIDGKPVHGEYHSANNSVTFERKVKPNETWAVSWFYAGAFTADFSTCFRPDYNMDAIMDEIKTILAYATVSAWGDKEVGRVLEVRNILTDHDFKMYSPANSARAKTEWRNQMNRDMDTLASSLGWSILSTPKGGSRFGK